MRRPVSVIVLTWNGLEVTRRCLDTLLGKTTHPELEVLVVDNGSTDGTVEYLRGLGGIRLIENGENLGFVRGNNVGLAATDRDVVLLNNDTEITQPDWLERIQDTAYSAPDVGVVGCRLVNAAGNLVHVGTYMPMPSFWGQEYPGNERDIAQYSRDRDVEGVIFACAYIKREVMEKVGLLDEDYFSYYEDSDYCLKARKAGYRTMCCGSATVLHLENASTDVNRMDFSGTFRKSREVFLSKWKETCEARYTRSLTWRSFISGEDPYSQASAKLTWALDAAGVELDLAFLEGVERAELADFKINDMKNREADRGRPQVVFGPAERLGEADGAFNIAYVFTRSDSFSPEQASALNRMDMVWVPSGFHREACLAAGVKRPVEVVPPGVDPDYLNPDIKAYPLPDRFTFLAPLEWGPSFATETLLRAFTDEFSAGEKAVLVVLLRPPSAPVPPGVDETPAAFSGAEVEEAVEAMSLALDRAPVVFVMDHDIPRYQSGSVYRSADCVVLASRAADGWTVAAESLACGVPVVCTAWGSSEELIDGGACRGVKASMVPAPGGGRWAEPDYDSLRSSLRDAFGSAEEMRGQALEASDALLAGRTWEKTAAGIVKILDGIRTG
ncbi:MAG: glycosyltransferase [Actinomycetota bacterium]